MIVGQDIHPERKIYHTGALLIEVLAKKECLEWELFELYAEVRKKHHLSLNAFVLSLDWLFITGAIQFSNGRIEKCF